VRSMGSRTEKLPFRNALSAARSWRPSRSVGLIAVRLPIDVSQPLSLKPELSGTRPLRGWFDKANDDKVGEACVGAETIPADLKLAPTLLELANGITLKAERAGR